VAASDYEGLGIAGETHPYLVGAASGHNLLDAARAASVVDGGDDVVILGLSQGGHAALFARTLAEDYAPELDVHGVAAAAPVTNVASFLLPGFTDPRLFPFLAEAALSWSEVYEEPDLDDVFVVDDAEGARLARDEACTDDLAPTRPLDQIIRDEPEDVDHWQTAVTVNSTVAGAPGIPVLLTHGDADPLVPIAGTLAYRDELCTSGEAVRLLRDPAWVHVSAWVEPLPDILTWIGGRFAGTPAPDDCP
jgi:pimeloyl-ACP methyl ester carboxylesterase